MVWGMVNTVYRALFMFATKFGDEGEVTFPIKRPFYLCNEVA